jgi:hypothetical protein
MSFTAAYSPLFVLPDDEAPRDRSPRILDRDGFDTVPDQLDLSESTFQTITVLGEETDHSEYPSQTWETLQGFKTWTPADAFLDRNIDKQALVQRIERHEDRASSPLGYTYNIERMGIPYGGLNGEWKRLFQAVSDHTEPFGVYHSPHEHSFPDVTEFDTGAETVYYAEFDDGAAYIEERTFEQTETEVLCDDDE